MASVLQFKFGAGGVDCLRCASGAGAADGQRYVIKVPRNAPLPPASATNTSCPKCTKPSLSLLEMAKLRSQVRDAIKQSKALREAAKQGLKSGNVEAAVGRYAEAIGVCKGAILKTQVMGTGKAAHGGSVERAALPAQSACSLHPEAAPYHSPLLQPRDCSLPALLQSPNSAPVRH